MDNLIYFLQHNICYWLIFAFIFGACIGSFLNVVIYRVPIMLQIQWQEATSIADETDSQPEATNFNLATPASHCTSCQHKLSVLDNIPLIGYFLRKGKCRYCGASFSKRYVVIEWITALTATALAYYYGPSLLFITTFIFLSYLVALSAIDIEHKLLPDMLTLSLLWLGLLININGTFTTLTNAVIGGCIGYLSFWFIFQIHYALTKKEGMGYGDFKLLAALGAWLGWKVLPMIALIASISGLLYALYSRLFDNSNTYQSTLPFGPFLAIGGVVVILFGDSILDAYLQLIL